MRQPGLQDYPCTGELNEGKYVKISRFGKLNLCEVKVWTLQPRWFHEGIEKEATIVQAYESSVSYDMKANRLIDGQGIDGNLKAG